MYELTANLVPQRGLLRSLQPDKDAKTVQASMHVPRSDLEVITIKTTEPMNEDGAHNMIGQNEEKVYDDVQDVADEDGVTVSWQQQQSSQVTQR